MKELWNSFLYFLNEYVVGTIKEIRIVDVIDILLLGLILFFCYHFVRSKGAVKIILGLALILFLYFLASAFNMYALKYLFDNFLQVGIIAVIVLFQPEMRKVLEKVGGTTFSGIKGFVSETKEETTVNDSIEALATAAGELSRDKVGALIVIERSSSLDEYINTGVEIDSKVTPYILRNVFFDKAPLHDGAVIIRKGRLCAAACFLPLSDNDKIDKDLGTRHRAAIGLSEHSDALVIIVSEETGVISIAMDGELTRNYNYKTLKSKLVEILFPQNSSDHHRRHHRKERK